MRDPHAFKYAQPHAPSGGGHGKARRPASDLVAIGIGLIVAFLLLIFILQNDERQRVEFLWIDSTVSTGVAMLVAALLGGMVVVLFSLTRMVTRRSRPRTRNKRVADEGER